VTAGRASGSDDGEPVGPVATAADEAAGEDDSGADDGPAHPVASNPNPAARTERRGSSTPLA
jgi:hypothetical protein